MTHSTDRPERGPSDWEIGDVIDDRYEVLETLTAGGMGVVHRVRHLEWSVDLAVKAPRSELITSATALQNFVTEAETWVGLGLHPHTVSCAYVRTFGALPCIFAEWVDGGSLADAVHDRRLYAGGTQRAMARILDVSIQLAWGLGHAHDSGLVHQDVKPANALLAADDGPVKITDFGVARAVAAAASGADGELARFGGMTPAYCSPEQAEAAAGGPRVVSRATDVWSWALTVLEMFAGAPPTRFGQAGAEALADFLAEPGPDDSGIPVMPPAVADLLARCLVADPAARAPMRALADELVAVHADVLGAPYPRRLPQPARLLADGLSNHALSLLDLGLAERAEEMWDRALAADPNHPHTIYNRGLHRWRNARCTDLELVADLETVRSGRGDGALAARMLGHVHLERGDAAAAAEVLAGPVESNPDDADARAALALARRTPCGSVVLGGHTRPVSAVALAANAGIAVTGSHDGTTRVWDIASGRCRYTLHHGEVGAVAVSADGRVGASGHLDGAVRLWDVPTGAPGPVVSGHGGAVRGIAVSADGRLLLTAADDGTVCLWSCADGHEMQLLEAGRSTGAVWRSGPVAFTCDEQWVVVGGGHDPLFGGATPVRVRQLGADVPAELPGDWGVAVSAGGTAAMTRADGTGVRVWDLRTRDQMHSIRCAAPWRWPAAVTDDGRTAVTSSVDGTVTVWDLPTGQCVRTIRAHTHGAPELALSGDGALALSGGPDAAARLLVLPVERHRAPWSYVRPRSTEEVATAAARVRASVSRAEGLVAAGRPAEAIDELRVARAVPGHERDPALLAVWRRAADAGRCTDVLGAWRQVTAGTRPLRESEVRLGSPVALAADGTVVVAGEADGTVRAYDPASGRCLFEGAGHRDGVVAVALTPDGRTAVTGAESGAIRVWDAEGGLRHTLEGTSRGPANLLAVAADGRVALSAGLDGQVRVWDLTTERIRHRLPAADGFVQALAMDAAATTAVTCGFRGSVQLWDLASGRRRRVLSGHDRFVRSVAVSADGRIALTGSDDRTARLWDLRSGRSRGVLAGHTAPVTALALGAQVAVTSGADSIVRVWNLPDGGVRHVLAGHNGWVNALAVSADGSVALSGGADGSVRVWDLRTGGCLRVLHGHPGEVDRVAITGDGRFVLAGSGVGTAVVWELDWDVTFPAVEAPPVEPAGGSVFRRLFRRER